MVGASLRVVARCQSTPQETVSIVWHQVDLVEIEPAKGSIVENVRETATLVKDGIDSSLNDWRCKIEFLINDKGRFVINHTILVSSILQVQFVELEAKFDRIGNVQVEMSLEV